LVASVGVVPRTAFVSDLSTNGLGVVTTDPPPPGTVVPIRVAGPPGPASRLLLARVIYCLVCGEGLYRLGLSCIDDSGMAVLNELLQHLGTLGLL